MNPSIVKFRAAMASILAVAVLTVFSLRSLAARSSAEAQDLSARSTATKNVTPLSLDADSRLEGTRLAGDKSDDQKKDGVQGSRPDGSTAKFPTGYLEGRGRITVNDKVLQAGSSGKVTATIMTGDKIITGADGTASVDLGTLGHFEMGHDTELVDILSDGTQQLNLKRCGILTQNMFGGVLGVLNPATPLKVEVRVRDGEVEVKHGSQVTIVKKNENKKFDNVNLITGRGIAEYKVDCNTPVAGYYWPGRLGLLGLIGVIGGITTGIVLGGPRDKIPAPPLPPGPVVSPILP